MGQHLILCPTCGQSVQVVEEQVGRWIDCPGCGSGFGAVVEEDYALPFLEDAARASGCASEATVDCEEEAPPGRRQSLMPRPPVDSQVVVRDTLPWGTMLGAGSLMFGVLSLAFIPLPIFWPLSLPLGVLGGMWGIASFVAGTGSGKNSSALFSIIGIMLCAIGVLVSGWIIVDLHLGPSHSNFPKAFRI